MFVSMVVIAITTQCTYIFASSLQSNQQNNCTRFTVCNLITRFITFLLLLPYFFSPYNWLLLSQCCQRKDQNTRTTTVSLPAFWMFLSMFNATGHGWPFIPGVSCYSEIWERQVTKNEFHQTLTDKATDTRNKSIFKSDWESHDHGDVVVDDGNGVDKGEIYLQKSWSWQAQSCIVHGNVFNNGVLDQIRLNNIYILFFTWELVQIPGENQWLKWLITVKKQTHLLSLWRYDQANINGLVQTGY